MLKRIDLFMPPISEFGVLQHFTVKLHEAFQNIGVKSRVLVAEKTNPKRFFDQIAQDPPEITVSFNGILPDEKGNFLCEILRIPHVGILADSDSPVYYIPLTQSKLNLITCPDRFFCTFFQNLQFNNVFFLPQGIEKDITCNLDEIDRPYDVTLIGNCFDYVEQKEQWKKKYPDYFSFALERAAELALSNLEMSFPDALVQAMNERVWFPGMNLSSFNFIEVLNDLEYYVRGIDRIELIKNIRDAKIHIFTPSESKKTWTKLLGKKPKNVTFHKPVPFEEGLEVMRKSKIVLSSTPTLKNGVHQRVFAAFGCGSLAMTNESIYLKEEGFRDGENILFYRPTDLGGINDKVNLFLTNHAMRVSTISQGRAKVMKKHTWENRASTLLKQVEPILETIKSDVA